MAEVKMSNSRGETSKKSVKSPKEFSKEIKLARLSVFLHLRKRKKPCLIDNRGSEQVIS